jgi:hypothetical protein
MLLKINSNIFDNELLQIAICVYNDDELIEYKKNFYKLPHKIFHSSLIITKKTVFLKVGVKDILIKTKYKNLFIETFYKVLVNGKIYWISKDYFSN